MATRQFEMARSWTLVRFELSDDELGYLLERNGTLFAYEESGERCVPAFRSREAALEFVKQIDPSIDHAPVHVGFYDLRAVEAFVDRRAPGPPPASLDVWSLLGEVAAAADRAVLRPAVTGSSAPGSSLTEPLRMVLANGLDVFRDVVTHVDAA
jgi:hypothetical protein